MLSADEGLALLGPVWARFVEQCDVWVTEHHEALASRFSFTARESDWLSFELGLILHDGETDQFSYDATPDQSWVFAHTGGDGEYLVVLGDPSPGAIVLIAPMAFAGPAVVIAASVEEFLAVLVTVGMSPLVDLAYREAAATVEDLVPDIGELHRHLARALDLEPVADPAARIRHLNSG